MRKGIALIMVSCLVLAGCKSSTKDTSTNEIVLESNQSLKYGQVSKINGNEITISWANEVSSSDMSSMKGNRPNATGDANNQNSSGQSSSGQTSENNTSNKEAGGNAPSGDMPSGNAPSGDMPSGDAPSGNNQGDGGMPAGDNQGGGNMPSSDSQGGNMGGGTPPDMSGNQADGSGQSSNSSNSTSQNSQSSGRENGSQSNSTDQSTSGRGNKGNSSSQSGKQNKTMYQLTGEEDTITIPVGTKVTTMLGTTTTFSRIAANDTLKLLMQKNDAGEDVVVGIWIVA